MPLNYFTKTPEQTLSLGQKLAEKLQLGDTVLLFGDLGSGKTHLSKGIAKGLNIKATIKSPTFAYVNRYPLENNEFFYHYDLYRLNPGDDTSSIGLEESLEDPEAINVVEWSDRMTYFPQKYIRIQAIAQQDHHEFQVTFIDPKIPHPKDIKFFLDHFLTPMHVRDHMKQVANVAMQISRAYAKIGVIINADLLYTAAILHDVARVCDFRTLQKDTFHEEVTDEKWKRWETLRDQYKGIHHCQIARDFLSEKNFKKTGDLIYSHGSHIIVQQPEFLESLEAKILYYADKRVKHDQVVSLSERFRDANERYGKYNDAQTNLFFEKVKNKTFEMEEKLFTPLNISPEQIM